MVTKLCSVRNTQPFLPELGGFALFLGEQLVTAQSFHFLLGLAEEHVICRDSNQRGDPPNHVIVEFPKTSPLPARHPSLHIKLPFVDPPRGVDSGADSPRPHTHSVRLIPLPNAPLPTSLPPRTLLSWELGLASVQ